MATIKTIARSWRNLSAEEKAANKEAVAYVAEMATNMGLDVSRWAFEPFCENGDRKRVIKDRNRLNQVLFRLGRDGAEEDPEDPIDGALRDQLHEVLHKAVNRDRGNLEARIENLDAAASALQRQLEENERQAADARAALAALEAGVPAVAQTRHERLVEALASQTFFRDPILREGELWLATPKIVLSVRPRGMAPQTVDLGRFAVRLELVERLGVSVRPLEDNRAVEGYTHPHVSGGGAVCYGTAQEAVRQAQRDYDVSELLTILETVLTTYHAGNPYVALERFSRARRFTGYRSNPQRERLLEEQGQAAAAAERRDPTNLAEALSAAREEVPQ